jgi:hypothetical protein
MTRIIQGQSKVISLLTVWKQTEAACEQAALGHGKISASAHRRRARAGETGAEPLLELHVLLFTGGHYHVTEFLRDIRFGSRLLWKSPGFAVVSLLALALGIGATTAIFSLLYSVLLAPLPYPDADRLVMVWEHRKGERINVTTEDYQDWQRQSTVFQTLGAWSGEGFTLSTANWTEEVQATRSSTGFFDSLIGQNVHLAGTSFPTMPKWAMIGWSF